MSHPTVILPSRDACRLARRIADAVEASRAALTEIEAATAGARRLVEAGTVSDVFRTRIARATERLAEAQTQVHALAEFTDPLGITPDQLKTLLTATDHVEILSLEQARAALAAR